MEIVFSPVPIQAAGTTFKVKHNEDFTAIVKDSKSELVFNIKHCNLEEGLLRYNIDNPTELIRDRKINELVELCNEATHSNKVSSPSNEFSVGHYDSFLYEGFIYCEEPAHFNVTTADYTAVFLQNIIFWNNMSNKILLTPKVMIPIRIITFHRSSSFSVDKPIKFFRPILEG